MRSTPSVQRLSFAAVDGRPAIEIDRPRGVWEIIRATFELYLRVPVLFLALAAIVVVPYELIVLAISGAGPITQGSLGTVASKSLLVADSFLITPLISAFHVHAIREIGEGGRPRLGETIRQSLPRLPIVAVAAGISGVAIGLGSIAFAIPGLLLIAIWPVVAQAAAMEQGGPIDALKRSFTLTRGSRWHSFWVVTVAVLLAGVVFAPLFLGFRHSDTTVLTFLGGVVAQVVVRSFEALATGLLYFDLLARSATAAKPWSGDPADLLPPPTVPVVAPKGPAIDPRSWTNQDRPAGWYIDPDNPGRMRYWAADRKGVWNRNAAKTPAQTLREWQRLQEDDAS